MPRGYRKRCQDASRKERRGGSSRHLDKSRARALEARCPPDWSKEVAASFRDFLEESRADINLPSGEFESVQDNPGFSIDERQEYTQTCAICLETKPLVSLMRQCNHAKACSSCLREFFVVQAQRDVSSYPLHCFFPSCHRIVTSDTLLRQGLLRSDEEAGRHYRLAELAKAYRGTRRVVHCPGCDHPKHYTSGAEVQCRRCRAKFRAFDPNETRRAMGRVQPTTEKTTIRAVENFSDDDVGINDGWGRCPSCKIIISKGSGCNHVACPCGHHFYFSMAGSRPKERAPRPEVQVQQVGSGPPT
jgi:hypothetical protein